MNRETLIRRLDRYGITAEYIGNDLYEFEKDFKARVFRLKEDVPDEFAVRLALYFDLPEDTVLED